MKQFFQLLSICLLMLFSKNSLAQCPTPTGYYSSVSTTNTSSGSGSNSLTNREGLVDGNLQTAATLTSTSSSTASPVIMSIDITLNNTIAANTYFYLKVSDPAGLSVQLYNGATLIPAADLTTSIRPDVGFSYFEFNSKQPVTRFVVTFTNTFSGQQVRQLYEFFSGTPCSLPVSLVSFTAKTTDSKAVQLNWVTSMERDNDFFTVERSKDLVLFESVTRVKAQEGTQGHTYSIVDEHPYFGTSYYRLKQTDLNGTTATFPATSVIVRNDAYGVFPNPVVDGKFALRLDEPQTAQVSLYGTDGRLLPLQKTGAEDGVLLLKTAKKLATGVYVLTVEERAQTRKYRVVIE